MEELQLWGNETFQQHTKITINRPQHSIYFFTYTAYGEKDHEKIYGVMTNFECTCSHIHIVQKIA